MDAFQTLLLHKLTLVPKPYRLNLTRQNAVRDVVIYPCDKCKINMCYNKICNSICNRCIYRLSFVQLWKWNKRFTYNNSKKILIYCLIKKYNISGYFLEYMSNMIYPHN